MGAKAPISNGTNTNNVAITEWLTKHKKKQNNVVQTLVGAGQVVTYNVQPQMWKRTLHRDGTTNEGI